VANDDERGDPPNTKGRPKAWNLRAPLSPFPPGPLDGRSKSVSVLCGWPEARRQRIDPRSDRRKPSK